MAAKGNRKFHVCGSFNAHGTLSRCGSWLGETPEKVIAATVPPAERCKSNACRFSWPDYNPTNVVIKL
jgi:hypothetical protein